MARYFEYPCPDCRTTTNLHDPNCRFDGRRWHEIEKAYTDLIACLSVEPRTERGLQEAVHERWSALHAAVLSQLRREHRVRETDEGVLELLTPEERKEVVAEPTRGPLRTIYEKGSVPGCHDHAIFSLIAYYEMVGLTWEETKANVVDWLNESGAWARGGFEESSPEDVVERKRHIYEQGYGWKQAAEEAAAVIERNV